MKLTPAQLALLTRAVAARDKALHDGWEPVGPHEFAVCKALHRRGLIDMVWGKGAHRQFIRATADGIAAEVFGELERRQANLDQFRSLRRSLAA
jgi:hypothetical protein